MVVDIELYFTEDEFFLCHFRGLTWWDLEVPRKGYQFIATQSCSFLAWKQRCRSSKGRPMRRRAFIRVCIAANPIYRGDLLSILSNAPWNSIDAAPILQDVDEPCSFLLVVQVPPYKLGFKPQCTSLGLLAFLSTNSNHIQITFCLYNMYEAILISKSLISHYRQCFAFILVG
jgi:hypothetical protein